MAVAIFNPQSKTMHHPSESCGHITPFVNHIVIHSWASAEGRHARVVGKACAVCLKVSEFQIPPVIEDDDES